MKSLFRHIVYDIEDVQKGVTIWLFGDVHRDTPNFHEEAYNEFLRAAKNSQNPYYLGMGDYHDFMSVSEMKKMKAAGMHETTVATFDEIAERHNRDFVKISKQMIGRTIALIGGNHQYQFEDGKWADEDLAERLKTEYAGYLSVIDLRLFKGKKRENKFDRVMRVFACHGKGGGKLIGTSINQVADMANIFEGVDIMCMGHDHKRSATPQPILYLDNHGNIKERRRYFIRTGSFMKSYEYETAGYAQGKLLRPVDMGAVRLNVKLTFNSKGIGRLNIEAVI